MYTITNSAKESMFFETINKLSIQKVSKKSNSKVKNGAAGKIHKTQWLVTKWHMGAQTCTFSFYSTCLIIQIACRD
jgi:hypothetical protein